MIPIPNVTRFEGSIRLLGQNPGMMTLQGTNSYLIGTSQNRLLVDTSEPNKPDYIKLLADVLKEEAIKVSDIIITHWHHDHIGSLKDVQKLVDESCRVWKFPRGDDCRLLGLHELTDGLEFKVDGARLKVYHTPGHTTDHAILHDEERKIVYSGDCILGEGTAVFEDLFDYMRSLEKILALKPEKIFPAHGNVVEDAGEKIKFYIEHRMERERQILGALSGAQEALNAMGIVEIVYRETPEEYWRAAAVNVLHHLEKLKKEGKIMELREKGESEMESLWQVAVNGNKL